MRSRFIAKAYIFAYSIKQFSASLPELEADILKIRGIKKGVTLSFELLISVEGAGKYLWSNKYTKIHAPWREPSAFLFSTIESYQLIYRRTRASSSVVYVLYFFIFT